MSILIERVRAADLIRAEDWNDVAEAIEALDARLAKLESADPGGDPSVPVITDVDPDEPVARGIAEIRGRNFEVPAVINTITFGGVQATGFQPGSTNSLLRVAVPGNLTGLPRELTLRIDTPRGSATKQIRVVPESAQPEGRPSITPTSTGIGTIDIGTLYTFSFRIDAINVTIPETYRIEAQYSDAVGASVRQWEDATNVIGLPDDRVNVIPGVPVTVAISVTVPDGAKSVGLSLRATSIHNEAGSSATSLPVPLIIGQEVPDNSPLIHVDLGQLTNSFRLDAGPPPVLRVRYPTSGSRNVNVPITVRFDVGGTFDYTATLANPGSFWTLGTALPTSSSPTAGTSLPVSVPLALKVTGPSGERRTLVFEAKRKETSSPGQISSRLVIPIEGF